MTDSPSSPSCVAPSCRMLATSSQHHHHLVETPTEHFDKIYPQQNHSTMTTTTTETHSQTGSEDRAQLNVPPLTQGFDPSATSSTTQLTSATSPSPSTLHTSFPSPQRHPLLPSSTTTPRGVDSESAVAAATWSLDDGTTQLTDLHPHSSLVDPMLTDLYEITMTYAYWCIGRHEDEAVFDVFFRKHPFGGEFTIFAGLEEVVRFVSSYRFTVQHVELLKKKFPTWNEGFWLYLAQLDCSNVKLYAVEEGTIVIPRIPLIRVEGPLAVCQLLETTILVLVNYPSLIATNAARHRLAVGPSKSLLEFGLRRAQGPDGGVTASRYAYMGNFDATSNVKAALMFGIPVVGTAAHSYISSFESFNDLSQQTIVSADGRRVEDFVSIVLKYRTKLSRLNTNNGELAAFIGYAQAYPNSFLALIDTYSVLESGLWNFVFVALALHECGYQARGIRVDSGDLSYLSKECRKLFVRIADEFNVTFFAKLTIVASNDLSEKVLWSLREQGHEIDAFAIGTNIVTCKTQPSLGCVYKLVQVNDRPRIKVSDDASKVTIPGRKEAYRLFNAANEPVLDLLVQVGTPAPQPHKRILCRSPFDANKRVYVTPSRVELLHSLVYAGQQTVPFVSLREVRQRVNEQLRMFREDHLRRLNPTPYKLSVTSDLYTFMHDLWLTETPIAEIK